LQTEAISRQASRLQWITGEAKIPFDAIYEPQKYLKEKNISAERIAEWDKMEKEKLSKLDKFGKPI
jgi:hypothetical protein